MKTRPSPKCERCGVPITGRFVIVYEWCVAGRMPIRWKPKPVGYAHVSCKHANHTQRAGG